MKYEYVHKKFTDLDQAVSYAHSLNWRIIGFSLNKNSEWSVVFEKVIDKVTHMSDTDTVNMIMSLMDTACAVSHIKKPWSDNVYGRAASALCYTLPIDHPLSAQGPDDWPLSRLPRFQVNPDYVSDTPMTDRYGRRVRSIAEFKADLAENQDFLPIEATSEKNVFRRKKLLHLSSGGCITVFPAEQQHPLKETSRERADPKPECRSPCPDLNDRRRLCREEPSSRRRASDTDQYRLCEPDRPRHQHYHRSRRAGAACRADPQVDHAGIFGVSGRWQEAEDAEAPSVLDLRHDPRRLQGEVGPPP